MIILDYLVIYFFIGFIIGCIDEFNEKLYFVLIVFCTVTTLYSIYSGYFTYDLASQNISNWWYFLFIPVGVMGARCGSSSVKELRG